MPFNAGTLSDLMELYAGMGGVNRDRINRKLIRQVINMKLQEFARRTGAVESSTTRQTVSGQKEYELADNVLPDKIYKVNFDGKIAYKMRHEQVDEFAENYS